jgi:glycosyltransferase involved in cell wall biosynthesis
MSITEKAILIVGHSSGKILGGAELSLLDNIRSLVALNRRVVVIIPEKVNQLYIEKIRTYTQEIYFINIPWNVGKNEPKQEIIKEIIEIADKTKAEMILSNTITLIEPLIAAKRISIPSVCIVREVPENGSSLANLLNKTLDQIIAEIHSLSDYIIANSLYTIYKFHSNGRSAVVRNTFNEDLLAVSREKHLKFCVGFVGNSHPEKGFDDFIKIARRFESDQNIHFLAYGLITSELSAEMAIELPRNIELRGYETDHVKIYANLDLLIQPSYLNETFSRVTLEAMASGIPVIAYNRGALSELFDNGANGFLIKPGDIDELHRLVNYLASNLEINVGMGQNARNYARMNYAPELQIQDLRRALIAVTDYHNNMHFSSDLKIVIPELNRSQFKDPFLVGNRARFATATGVKFISNSNFVVASLLGKQLHLFEFDPILRTSKLLVSIDSQNGSNLVSLDAIDFNGKDLLIGSDCEFSSISTYRVSNSTLEYAETIPVGNDTKNYVHGATFVTPDSKIVAACITDGEKGISFYNKATKRRIGHFQSGEWGVKDMAMLGAGSNRFIAVLAKSNVGQELGTKHAINLVLVQTNKRFFKFKKFKIVSEFLIPDESIECILIRGEYIFLASQSADSIIVIRHENDKLYKVDDLQGFSFPHGVDISPDGKWMGVANYGTSSISIRENIFSTDPVTFKAKVGKKNLNKKRLPDNRKNRSNKRALSGDEEI